MAEISLCMIVRNEEETLARCLDSVRDAVEEIIIVDTGSQDATRDIARRYTSKVFGFPWRDDFSAARNAALEHVTREFWMWLDADDVLDGPEALNRFKSDALDGLDLVMAPYHIAFDKRGEPTFTYYRERILRTAKGFRWAGAVHEAISPRGRVGYADFAVRHQKIKPGEPGRNLRIYDGLRRAGHSFSARERYYYGRELREAGRLEEAVQELESVVRDRSAWLENRLGACVDLADCRLKMGDAQAAARALSESLALDAPRAQAACELGKLFLAAGNLSAARFWYEAALGLKEDARKGAFVQKDYSGYIPLMQLCVIYDRLGLRNKAEAVNEQAALLKPGDPSVEHNRRYFQDLRER